MVHVVISLLTPRRNTGPWGALSGLVAGALLRWISGQRLDLDSESHGCSALWEPMPSGPPCDLLGAFLSLVKILCPTRRATLGFLQWTWILGTVFIQQNLLFAGINRKDMSGPGLDCVELIVMRAMGRRVLGSESMVRAHQLVLPPCDVVIKAVADYVRNIQDTLDLDAIAKDVFQHSQSRTDDKVVRFKRAIGYYSATSKPMTFHPPHYLARPNPFGMPGIVPPYVPPQMLNIPQTSLQAKPVAPQVPGPGASGQGPHPYSLAEPGLPLERSGKSLTEHNSYSSIPHEGKHTPLYERASPIDPAHGGSPNHVDAACFPGSPASSSSDNDEGSGGAANHISGNKIGWEKTGSHPQPPARGDPGDQAKAVGHASHALKGWLLQPGVGLR
ncbi:hypothetical protein MC885_002224 [Smutsia gigantea]|nr:hypothetical protein MC885_002224 [Smutsia gigantea]